MQYIIFTGFSMDSIEKAQELNLKLNLRRIPELEEIINRLVGKVESLESDHGRVVQELNDVKTQMQALKEVNADLKEENENLKEMKYEVQEVKKQREELQQAVKDVEEKQVVWIQKSEGSVDSMKKIIDEQMKVKRKLGISYQRDKGGKEVGEGHCG